MAKAQILSLTQASPEKCEMSNHNWGEEVSTTPLCSERTCNNRMTSAHTTCRYHQLFTMEKILKIGKRVEGDRNNNLVTRREFLQSFLRIVQVSCHQKRTKQRRLILSGKLFVLIGVALFLKFGCHGYDYIDGMLTGRAVAHKWFATERTPLKFDTANCRNFGGFETM